MPCGMDRRIKQSGSWRSSTRPLCPGPEYVPVWFRRSRRLRADSDNVQTASRRPILFRYQARRRQYHATLVQSEAIALGAIVNSPCPDPGDRQGRPKWAIPQSVRHGYSLPEEGGQTALMGTKRVQNSLDVVRPDRCPIHHCRRHQIEQLAASPLRGCRSYPDQFRHCLLLAPSSKDQHRITQL